ncbi:MAG: hypothetical protein JWM78_3355 [Verrucomicrobiaceae bacterium]|nr:hypothetical protein [Verrucomicrobiaceae bacterium]
MTIDRTPAKQVSKLLRSLGDADAAERAQRFFKTAKGEYGERDKFIGLSVPVIRAHVKQFSELPLDDIIVLLQSPFNEERVFALLSLSNRFTSGDEELQKTIYELFLQHRQHVNNWNLVDSSAAPIVGAYLHGRDKAILYELAVSSIIWERRIAMIAAFYFIRANDFSDALKTAALLRDDTHDLIHKAVGWMLREIGKRDTDAEKKFLKKHYRKMPRTMLRYAIEKFPEHERLAYLAGEI